MHADCDDRTVISNYQQSKAAGQPTPYKCPDCRHRPHRGYEIERRRSASPLDDGKIGLGAFIVLGLDNKHIIDTVRS